MYSEDDLLPISGLYHLVFCERQWALIHIENVWTENVYTVEGKILHERVHELDDEKRGGVRIVRGLRLRSLRLGLSGQADVVEFYRNDAGGEAPFPVEYKRGRHRLDQRDEVQLCAQALCLEEMLNVSVQSGAIFYGQPRRRHEVKIGTELREKTTFLAKRMHKLFQDECTPLAVYESKCEICSLMPLCMPKVTGKHDAVADYFESAWKEVEEP